MFLTLSFFACSNNSSEFLFAVNNITSKFFLSFKIISTRCFPIEPVDPRIAIFFFHSLNKI